MTAGLVTLLGRLIRLTGNICKMACYPFHALFAGKRFFIPAYSPAKIRRGKTSSVPGMIWQTNYSNCCSLPMYLNYLFNRLMSLDYDYRYVSTEEREEYLRTNAPPEVYEAYLRLTDGAAQADLWRVTVLYLEGGIYMDIDATLVLPLRIILKGIDNALFVRIKHNTELTNYFLATVPGNP
ncbi:MAG: glycosyltransferase family 32 protein, partial [Kiritimatiellia bacterium]